jgi:hypothetical protein
VSAGRRVAVTVAAASAGERLDRFLATVGGLGTRSRVKQLIDAERARVDGVVR